MLNKEILYTKPNYLQQYLQNARSKTKLFTAIFTERTEQNETIYNNICRTHGAIFNFSGSIFFLIFFWYICSSTFQHWTFIQLYFNLLFLLFSQALSQTWKKLIHWRVSEDEKILKTIIADNYGLIKLATSVLSSCTLEFISAKVIESR